MPALIEKNSQWLQRLSRHQRWMSWAGANLFFALCHPALGGSFLPSPLRSLGVNLALFVVPAIGWGELWPSTRALGMRLARAVAISTVAYVATLAFMALAAIEATDVRAWSALWLIANLGFVAVAYVRPTRVSRRSLLTGEIVLGGVSLLAAFAFFYWGAVRVVPPQRDQDLEVMATGFSLVTRFEPLLLTDRHSVYFFAHPPLLHFYLGGSFLLSGALEDLRFYDEASRRVRDAWEGRAISPSPGPIKLRGLAGAVREDELAGTYEITAVDGKEYLLRSAVRPSLRLSIEDVELDRIYAEYFERPHLVEARTPNIFFGACTVTLLALWTGRLSRRWWLGALVAVAYATSPEVFVRSSYGGYFAIGALASVLLLLAVERSRRRFGADRRGLLAVWSGIAALADHKLVLLPAAIALISPFRSLRPYADQLIRVVGHPAVVGFAGGTLLFWSWGLSIAPTAFVEDHFHHHLIDRLTHTNPFGYGGYPTAAELWLEFVSHTSYLLLPVGLGLLSWDVWRGRHDGRRQRPFREMWLLWIGLTASTFSLVDWRMTKHLVLLVLPLCLAMAPDRDHPRWRLVLPVGTLLILAAFNLWMVSGLARDFEAFKVTPAW